MFDAIAALLAMSAGPAATHASGCPFLPQYRRLQITIAKAPAASALRSLYRYAGDPANENPAACEAIELDRQIAQQERRLVALVATTRLRIAPDTAFHCSTPDPRTTQCDGIVADGTAQPDAVRIRAPSALRKLTTARLDSNLPDARLIGLYRSTLADVAAGRPAKRLKPGTTIALASGPADGVLIALFTAPAPYKVRKFVWYY